MHADDPRRDELVAAIAERIYLHAFAAFKVRGRMMPAVDRANRATARRTADKVVSFLAERYDLQPKREVHPPG